jgi:hypothetical protein
VVALVVTFASGYAPNPNSKNRSNLAVFSGTRRPPTIMAMQLRGKPFDKRPDLHQKLAVAPTRVRGV